jgi:hypothetical protein
VCLLYITFFVAFHNLRRTQQRRERKPPTFFVAFHNLRRTQQRRERKPPKRARGQKLANYFEIC